jgi:hopanoid biosynthesis associated RND transporter like protein HpnN
VESVATYYDLKKHEETRGGTAEVLASSLNEAEAIAKKVSALPEVAQVMTINSFVPDRQEEKLAKIKDAAQRILPSIAPEQKAPPPTDAEELQSIRETHAALTQAAERNNGTRGAQAAQRLATALSHLVDAGKDLRSRVSEALVTPLEITLRDLKESLQPQTITLASIPDDIKSNWLTPKEQARVSITPKEDTGTNAGLKRFVDAVERVEPSVTGEPVGLQKAGESILDAFIQAAALALVSIFILLLLTLRRLSDVLVTLLPLLLAGVVTLELCVIFGLKLNFANIIALPVLLGIGVAFKIYYVMAWREGRSGLLASPLTRAVFYSGMTTAVGFGSLWLSNHPGTSSMGELLALALVSTMAAAVLFQPLLMGPPREKKVKRVYLETAEHTF